MTRRLMKTALLGGAALLALGFGVAPVLADTTDTSSSDSSSSSSVGPTSESTSTTAEFDTDPNATITLSSAPNISFGKNITPNGPTNGNYTAVTVDNPIGVSNPGLGSGWNVQVKNTPFTDAAGDTLSGAVLALASPTIAAANTGNPSAKPDGMSLSLDGTNANEILLSAPLKGGLGIWDASYSPSGVTLAIPAGQMGGTYTSTMTWQLSDTPE